MSPTELAEYVTKAQSGDRIAIEEIYAYLTVELGPLLRSRHPPGIEADDVFQETTLIVLQRLCYLRYKEKIAHYAKRIFRRLVSRGCSECHRKTPLLDNYDVPSPDQSLLNLERTELLERLYSVISADDRLIFVLVYLQGLGNAEIAERLHISNGLVRRRKHDLNVKLRAALVRWAKEGQPSSRAALMIS